MSRGTAAVGAARAGAAAGRAAGGGAVAGGAAGSTGPWNKIAGSSVSSSMKLWCDCPTTEGKDAGRTGTVVPASKKSRSHGEDLEG